MTGFMFPYDCQIISRSTGGTAVTYDDYGNAIPQSGTVETRCDLQQSQRREPGDQGEMSVTVWRLYLPTGTALDTTDAVVVKGLTYEAIGDPWDADSGTGDDVNHVEATVARTI